MMTLGKWLPVSHGDTLADDWHWLPRVTAGSAPAAACTSMRQKVITRVAFLELMLCRLMSMRLVFSLDWRGRPALSPLFVVHSGADVRTFLASLLNRRRFHGRSRQENRAAALASIHELEDRPAGAIAIEHDTCILPTKGAWVHHASRLQHLQEQVPACHCGLGACCRVASSTPYDPWHSLSSSCPIPGLDKKQILRKRMARGTHDGTAGPCCCRRLG